MQWTFLCRWISYLIGLTKHFNKYPASRPPKPTDRSFSVMSPPIMRAPEKVKALEENVFHPCPHQRGISWNWCGASCLRLQLVCLEQK